LFSPIFRPSEVPGADVDGSVLGSPFRFTEGAARTVSCAQSLHGLFDIFFFDVDDEAFDGPTVGVVVAERLDTVVVDFVEDIVVVDELSRNRDLFIFQTRLCS